MNSSSIFLVSVGLSWLSRFGVAGSDSAWAAMAFAVPIASLMSSRARVLPIWTPTMTRALSLLAALSSPVFVAAAIAGWLFEVWPATPLTLCVAAFVVLGGPMLGIVHVITAKREEDEEEPRPRRRSSRRRPPPTAPPRSAWSASPPC